MRITPRRKAFAAIPQSETITCVADVADSLDGLFFQLNDSAGSVGVWIDVDNSGTTIPGGASALDRAIEVTGVVTGDSAAAVATAVAAAINADSEFIATASGSVVTVVQATGGAVTAASDGDTGFTFAVGITGTADHNLTGIRAIMSLVFSGGVACQINGDIYASGTSYENWWPSDLDVLNFKLTTPGAAVCTMIWAENDPL